MFYEDHRSETSSTVNEMPQKKSKLKVGTGKGHKKLLEQNLNNYSSVPTPQSKSLRS